MAMTDPLGDMLTRIRNGQQAKKDSVLSPASKLRANVLEVLKREGYIRGFSDDASGKHPRLTTASVTRPECSRRPFEAPSGCTVGASFITARKVTPSYPR